MSPIWICITPLLPVKEVWNSPLQDAGKFANATIAGINNGVPKLSTMQLGLIVQSLRVLAVPLNTSSPLNT
jgi:hypothetical protein